MIPTQYRILAGAIALVLAAAFGAIAAGAAYYGPRLAAAQTEIKAVTARATQAEARAQEFDAAYRRLAAVTQEQTASIDALAARARARDAAATQAVAQAQQTAATWREAAARILRARPPAGGDPAVFAQSAFDAELIAEREGDHAAR